LLINRKASSLAAIIPVLSYLVDYQKVWKGSQREDPVATGPCVDRGACVASSTLSESRIKTSPMHACTDRRLADANTKKCDSTMKTIPEHLSIIPHTHTNLSNQTSIMKILLQLIAPLLSLLVLAVQRKTINFFLMGFFRDVGRIKARNRRLQNANAMISNSNSNWDILFKRDDPLGDIDFDAENDNNSQELSTFTMQELSEFGNGLDGRPILLSIFGRVYDVSAGSKFYGEGGNYHVFAGKDVTRALCTGCKTDDCLVRDTDGLTEKQLAEGKRWLSFFQLHDKYNYVGDLEGDREGWLDLLIETDIIAEQEKEQQDNVDLDLDNNSGETEPVAA
jgi:predicted heme/steroid binding protein